MSRRKSPGGIEIQGVNEKGEYVPALHRYDDLKRHEEPMMARIDNPWPPAHPVEEEGPIEGDGKAPGETPGSPPEQVAGPVRGPEDIDHAGAGGPYGHTVPDPSGSDRPGGRARPARVRRAGQRTRTD